MLRGQNFVAAQDTCKKWDVIRGQPFLQDIPASWPLNVSLRVRRSKFKALWLF